MARLIELLSYTNASTSCRHARPYDHTAPPYTNTTSYKPPSASRQLLSFAVAATLAPQLFVAVTAASSEQGLAGRDALPLVGSNGAIDRSVQKRGVPSGISPPPASPLLDGRSLNARAPADFWAPEDSSDLDVRSFSDDGPSSLEARGDPACGRDGPDPAVIVVTSTVTVWESAADGESRTRMATVVRCTSFQR